MVNRTIGCVAAQFISLISFVTAGMVMVGVAVVAHFLVTV